MIGEATGNPWGRRIAALLILLAGGAMAVQATLPLVWAESMPERAVTVGPGNGVALNWLANKKMLTSQSEADIGAVYELARKAAARAPIEAEAIRNAGFAVAAKGDEARADGIIGLAARASKRDYFAHAWLLDRKFRLNRVDGAVEEANIVLRQRQTSWPVILPELVRITADPRVVEPLAQTLATRPYWRSSYFEALGSKGQDQDKAYQLYRRVKALGAPPSTGEMQSWFYRFDGESDAASWYARWLNLLPKPIGSQHKLIRDGGFDGLDAPAPFTWRLYPGEGTYAEFSKSPDGPGRALYLSFEGTRKTDFAIQTLMLTPGRYDIGVRVFADEAVEKGKIGLALNCGRFVARRPIGSIGFAPIPGQWVRQFLTVDIPGDCPSPMLGFYGEQRNVLSPATVWADDVTVQRISAGAATPVLPKVKDAETTPVVTKPKPIPIAPAKVEKPAPFKPKPAEMKATTPAPDKKDRAKPVATSSDKKKPGEAKPKPKAEVKKPAPSPLNKKPEPVKKTRRPGLERPNVVLEAEAP